MASKAGKFGCRDAVSLIVAALSIMAIAVYQLFWRDYSGETFDLTADALYRFAAVPLACISISFFLSSRLVILRLSATALRALKVACVALVIAYLACVALVMLVDGSAFPSIREVALRYTGAFTPYVAIAAGLILGASGRGA